MIPLTLADSEKDLKVLVQFFRPRPGLNGILFISDLG